MFRQRGVSRRGIEREARHWRSLIVLIRTDDCGTCFGGSLIGWNDKDEKESRWFSREISAGRRAGDLWLQGDSASADREGEPQTIEANVPEKAASDDQESGRLKATAAQLFGAGKLVLGTDDGNVEGDKSAPAFVNGLKRSTWLLVRPPPRLHACVQPGE